MSAWNQIVLGCGYVFIGEAIVFIFAGIFSIWIDNRKIRRKEREVNELERMYEGH